MICDAELFAGIVLSSRERDEGFVGGLEVCGALNPRTMATVQLETLKSGTDT